MSDISSQNLVNQFGKIVGQLPDNLIDLLKVCVADARKCQADERYFMNMSCYHVSSFSDHRCHVCMAGGIISQTLKGDIHLDLNPGDYVKDTESKLYIIL